MFVEEVWPTERTLQVISKVCAMPKEHLLLHERAGPVDVTRKDGSG